ncbi:MAG: DNA methylase [Clostridia bacterium]|nr:DNA methylase [Clostridia bacterium]
MTDDSGRVYIAIDLKSFYASVECAARNRDPLSTNLVVADESRTEKTICLAVSPALKSYGIPGRVRLFEVIRRVKKINAERKKALRGRPFEGASDDCVELKERPELELDFIKAPPRMAEYIRVSSVIYSIYLRHVSPRDIFAYSIDEVFIDATSYLTNGLAPRDFALKIIRDVLHETGIPATAGVGTNLYLAKIAMDIVAKHATPDREGLIVAELDVMSYRTTLWEYDRLADFWRIGPGIARRLNAMGMFTMGDVARRSLTDDRRLYKEFGVNAEFIIDHAWGWDPTEISDVREYVPESSSLSSGQVLSQPYSFEKGRIIVLEMTDLLVLDLVENGLVTDQIILTIGYDVENLRDGNVYDGKIEIDRYGRRAPGQAHGSINLGRFTSSTRIIMKKVAELYDRITDRSLTIRRMYVVANNVMQGWKKKTAGRHVQMSIFDDPEATERRIAAERAVGMRERLLQSAEICLKKKYGKNAVLKCMDLSDGATTIARNRQIGGHRAADN